MRKSIFIAALAAVCLLSACQKESKEAGGLNSAAGNANNSSAIDIQQQNAAGQHNSEEQQDSGQENPAGQHNSEQPSPSENSPAAQAESLFELQSYDGTAEITLEWGGQQSLARFNKDPLMPFGLYVPEQMEVYEFEDGNRWGYDGDKHYISINKYDEIFLPDLTLQNEQLQKYEEYAGSKQEGTVITDSFVMEKDNKKYFVDFVYFETEQDKALPMFVEVARSIRYVSK